MKRSRALAVVVSMLAASAALAGSGGAATSDVGSFAYVSAAETLSKATGATAARCRGEHGVTGAGGALRGSLSATTFTDGGDQDAISDDAALAAGRRSGRRDATLKAFAVCLDDSGLVYNHQTTTVPAGDGRLIAAGCPAGKQLIGGGGGFLDRSGHLRSSFPLQGSWRVVGDNTTSTERTIEVYSVCITTASREVEYVAGTQLSPDPGVLTRLEAECPADLHVSSGGAATGATVRESRPFDGDDADRVPDDGWRTTVITDGVGTQAQPFAVCLGEPL